MAEKATSTYIRLLIVISLWPKIYSPYCIHFRVETVIIFPADARLVFLQGLRGGLTHSENKRMQIFGIFVFFVPCPMIVVKVIRGTLKQTSRQCVPVPRICFLLEYTPRVRSWCLVYLVVCSRGAYGHTLFSSAVASCS